MILNQNGIFSRAEGAGEKYNEAKARETLEIVLAGVAQYEKYGNPEGYNQNEILNKLITDAIPDSEIEGNYAIVGGYIYELDRSVPKIGKYIGPADGIIITASITQNGNWTNPVATVKGTIKTYSGGTITNSTATATNGVKIPSDFPKTGGDYTIENITKDTDIKITAEDSNGKSNEKTVQVRLVKDITAPTVSNLKVTAIAGLKIQITATGEDTESGVKNLEYEITSSTLENPITGTFASGETVEVATPTGTTYHLQVRAEDNAGHKSSLGGTNSTANIETRNNSSRSKKNNKRNNKGIYWNKSIRL